MTDALEEVNKIVERMRDTKVMRNLKDEVWNKIEEILISDEFVEMFKDELMIHHELSEEQIGTITELLIRELL